MPTHLQMYVPSHVGSSSGVVVKILGYAEQEVRGLIPGLAARISEICYLLLTSRDMAEILLKRRKSSKQTNRPFHV